MAVKDEEELVRAYPILTQFLLDTRNLALCSNGCSSRISYNEPLVRS